MGKFSERPIIENNNAQKFAPQISHATKDAELKCYNGTNVINSPLLFFILTKV